MEKVYSHTNFAITKNNSRDGGLTNNRFDMIRFIYTLGIVATSLLMTSCELFNAFVDWSPPEYQPQPCEKGFIQDYYHIDENVNIESEIIDERLVINFHVKNDMSHAINTYLNVEGENYNDYMEKYGDKAGFIAVDDLDNACAESIRGIDIISLQNWDEDHPAQSSLNDVFFVEYATYKYYVDSGFNDDEFSLTERESIESKLVSELQEDDMWFIHTNLSLICTSPPSDTQPRHLKISLMLDTGAVQTYKVNVKYLQ